MSRINVFLLTQPLKAMKYTCTCVNTHTHTAYLSVRIYTHTAYQVPTVTLPMQRTHTESCSDQHVRPRAVVQHISNTFSGQRRSFRDLVYSDIWPESGYADTYTMQPSATRVRSHIIHELLHVYGCCAHKHKSENGPPRGCRQRTATCKPSARTHTRIASRLVEHMRTNMRHNQWVNVLECIGALGTRARAKTDPQEVFESV